MTPELTVKITERQRQIIMRSLTELGTKVPDAEIKEIYDLLLKFGRLS